MDILHMTEQAFERGQWMELLIGKDSYHIPVSEFAGYLPTETGTLLSEGIYRLYLNRQEIKPALEDALLHMARTDAFGFYVAMAYLRAHVFREQRGLSPFRVESGILHEIGRCFVLHAESLKHGITDANGTHYPDALKDILRWNRVTKENYGVQILPSESSEYAVGGD